MIIKIFYYSVCCFSILSFLFYSIVQAAEYGPFDLDQIYSLEIKNGWGFSYKKDGNYYNNISGNVYGPYANSFVTDGNNTRSVFRKNDKEYVMINEKEYGPYDISYLKGEKVVMSNSNWGFKYMIDGKYYVNINGIDYGPYIRIGNELIVVDKHWSFSFTDGLDYYIMLDGIQRGPYHGAYDPIINNDNIALKYSRMIDKKIKNYVEYNGYEYGPYDNVGDVLIGDENWGFNYRIGNKDHYVIINGKEYGPYEIASHTGMNIRMNKGSWAFIYKKDEETYIMLNDNVIGPYKYNDIRLFKINNENFAFVASNKNSQTRKSEYFVVENDNKYGPFSQYAKDIILLDNGAFIFYYPEKDDDKWNYRVNVNGKTYFQGSNLKLATSKNSWVLYHIKDGKNYINFNGKNYNALFPDGFPPTIIKVSDNNFGYAYTITGGKKYAVINNVKYGPHDSIFGMIIEDNYTGLYYRDNKNAYFQIDDKNNNPIEHILKDGLSNSASVNGDTNYIKIKNKNMHARLKGKIMLRVESAGEAYYIHPSTQEMHYLGRPDDAFSVMREQGVGITNNNLEKIPIGLGNLTGHDSDGDGLPDLFEDAIGTDKNNQDTDGDSYNDKDELIGNYNPNGSGSLNTDSSFSNTQKGKIFLQVEKNGEAWYINPTDGKRYFLGRPADAFQVMRNLGLGISNSDFDSMQ